jgi:hypothetical protein
VKVFTVRLMKMKFIFFIALILGSRWLSKADETNNTFDVVEELNSGKIPESISNYSAINNLNLSPRTFAVKTDLGWITAAEYNRLKLSKGETRISSPLASKELATTSITDSAKVSHDKMKAHFVIFQAGHPRWQFDFTGFKNFDVDWIDEKVIKIVSWPGTRARVTELINVETGKIIYRSAEGIYDSLINST